MALIRQLRSFYARRIALPVGADALVLDVGSGDKPHWRADVLLDRYAGAEHGIQRSGRAAARVPRPLFDADAADMPFADQVFDYVVCSHLLEHVTDPGGVIDELVRVAKAGYIEVPRITSAKIADFPSHLWWCDLVDGELLFTAKERSQFDPDIERFVAEPGVGSDLQRLFDRNFDACIVRLPWIGSVRYRVVGTARPELVDDAVDGGHHRSVESSVSRVLTVLLSLPKRFGRRRRPTFNQLVKPELRRSPDATLERGLVTTPVST
ncbi:MAG: class I SAM-dependent methyltransferase [Acidimicrobiia bacterium]